MTSMDVIHVHVKREENMAKLGATFPLKQMITYEQCMKIGVVLTPLH